MPNDIGSRLVHHASSFQRVEFLDELESQPELHDIVRELDEICQSDSIVGIHYTRGEREHFLAEGLVPQTGATRREQFLRDHEYRFSAAQRERLVAGWDSYFNGEQNRARDGRIWFNLTRAALANGGADRLLSHYGGEVVYMPFPRGSDIESILGSIGSPLIVECALEAESVHASCQYPLGRTWLSSYHCSVNPAAYQFHVDLYTEEVVLPSNVLKVELLDTG